MPRGEKGPENLQRWRDSITPEQYREVQKKANKASREAARRNKTLRDYLQACLELKTETGTVAGDLAISLVQEALNGNVSAWQTLRDSVGEKPKDEVEVESKGGINIVIGDDDNE